MKESRKIIIAGVIGNVLENYDYILYANFAVVISNLFFPATDLYTSLLATFGLFAAGFFMRPLGAVVFGHIGDRYGRKLALSVSIMLMSIPTALIGILPTYAEVGILSPILLLIIRLLQGFSMGGETSGFMTYLMESDPYSKKKSLLGSVAVASTAFGLFCGFLSSFVCNFYFPASNYAWRIPFLISFPVGMIGIYIRNKLDESVEFSDLKKNRLTLNNPIAELFKNHKGRFLIICGLFVSISVPFYIFFGFLSTFMVKGLNYSQLQVSVIYLCCTFLFGCFSLLSGILSDRFGVYKVLISSIVIFVVLIFPIFYLILDTEFVVSFLGCVLFILIIVFYQGSIPSMISRIFPANVRASGTALSFNIVSAFFGGLTPFILTWFIKIYGNYNVIPVYLIIASSITILSVIMCRKSKII